MVINFKNVNHRKDYLSVDKLTAISAEGQLFEVGDVVETDEPENGTATITHFTLDEQSCDVRAYTEKGWNRICFIYKAKKAKPMKSYSEEELGELCSVNKVNYEVVIESMLHLWTYDKDVITSIVVAMDGSFDRTVEYLNLMESEQLEPEECWEQYCLQNDIEHEIENNPF